MNLVGGCAIGLGASFLMAVLLAPWVIRLMRRLHAGQPILHFVQEHAAKQGTPTMGGWVFVVPVVVFALVLCTPMGVGYIAAFATLAYAIIGFLDDFLKIKRSDNGGLKPYQKIVAQLGIAAVLCYYVYRNDAIGTTLVVPFSHAVWQVGWWIVPITAFVFLAGTNSVNLTDGLDGLAASTTATFAFGALLALGVSALADPHNEVYRDLAIFAAVLVGGLVAFLLFNVAPARIFMGDTGSMALGGAVCCLTVFARYTLYLPILGIIYVLTSISVIVQVGYFKCTKGKRLFLMAPFHHHLQRKGYSEPRVCCLYVALTMLAATLVVAGVYVGNYGVGQ